jgi:hypothetical protein
LFNVVNGFESDIINLQNTNIADEKLPEKVNSKNKTKADKYSKFDTADALISYLRGDGYIYVSNKDGYVHVRLEEF